MTTTISSIYRSLKWAKSVLEKSIYACNAYSIQMKKDDALEHSAPTANVSDISYQWLDFSRLQHLCAIIHLHDRACTLYTHHIVSCHWQCNHMEIVIISNHLSCNQFSSSAKEITRFCRRRLIKRMKLSVRREAHKINIGIIQVKNTRFWNGMRWSERKMKESEDWGKIAYVAIFYCAFYLYITS